MKDPYSKALEYALSLLALRARSAKEVTDKLTSKEYEPAVIEAVLARLTELKYINDEQFAKDFFQYQLNRGKGPEAARFELLKKGVAADIVTALLRAYKEHPETEIDQIVHLARSRFNRMRDLPPRDAARRLMGFLARRGFTLDNIQKALKQLQIELEEEEKI